MRPTRKLATDALAQLAALYLKQRRLVDTLIEAELVSGRADKRVRREILRSAKLLAARVRLCRDLGIVDEPAIGERQDRAGRWQGSRRPASAAGERETARTLWRAYPVDGLGSPREGSSGHRVVLEAGEPLVPLAEPRAATE